MAVPDAMDEIWHAPIPFGIVLSASGIAFSLLAVASMPFNSVSPGETITACTAFKAAGWLVSTGWLQRRRESERWPFHLPAVRDAVALVLHRTTTTIGLVLGLLWLASLSLLVFVVLSCLMH